MFGKIFPILLVLLGTGGGIAAGVVMRPEPDPSAMPDPAAEAAAYAEANPEEPNAAREYVKLSKQFVIPVVTDGDVSALVVMSLSVEVEPGYRDDIFQREPKIRDSFLQVLFDHSNFGGFNGAFTSAENIAVMREALLAVARRDAGDHVTDILILEIARQDY